VRKADPRGEELHREVQARDPGAVFVASPEALLLLLAALASSG